MTRTHRIDHDDDVEAIRRMSRAAHARPPERLPKPAHADVRLNERVRRGIPIRLVPVTAGSRLGVECSSDPRLRGLRNETAALASTRMPPP